MLVRGARELCFQCWFARHQAGHQEAGKMPIPAGIDADFHAFKVFARPCMFVLEGAILQMMGKLARELRAKDVRSSRVLSCVLAGSIAACAEGSDGRRKDREPTDVDAAQDQQDASSELPMPNESDADVADAAMMDASIEPLEDAAAMVLESREAYCAGEGAPVEVRVSKGGDGGTADQICTVGLASRIFQFGICSCSDLLLPGDFDIDAFDSDHPTDDNTSGASVGTNGTFTAQGGMRIRGSLVASGAGTLAVSGTSVRVDGNLRTNADLDIAGASISFRRDLWVNGDIEVSGLASVSGDVYQTPNHTLSPALTIGGSAKSASFIVEPPCACDEDEIVDVAAIVADGKAYNHNAELGLPADATLNMQGLGGVTLDCGRFFFGASRIAGSGNVLVAHGRTAVFIEGDLEIAGDFGVDVGTEGELDVFVSGNLDLAGAGVVGSVARPAALRFYVAGSETIEIDGALTFAANVYAPHALIDVGGADDIYGSLFAADVEIAGSHDMHYDRAIMNSDGGEKCEPPVPPPVPPEEPEGCQSDLECEAALVCEDGDCTPVLELL